MSVVRSMDVEYPYSMCVPAPQDTSFTFICLILFGQLISSIK